MHFFPTFGSREDFCKFGFLYIWLRPLHSGSGRAMNFTMLIPLTMEMLQTKHGSNWPCNIYEKVKNVKLLPQDGRRTPHDNEKKKKQYFV